VEIAEAIYQDEKHCINYVVVQATLL